jgi:hypothetical protein
VWERLLGLAQGRGVELGMAFLDGTAIRAHAKAAGARPRARPKRGELAPAGPPRGARTLARGRSLPRARPGGTKACVVADGRGRAVAFAPAPGQAHELPLAPGLFDRLPRVPLWVVGDRGYSSHELRERVWSAGAGPPVRGRRSRPGATRRRWPARPGSTTTATSSSASGGG